LLLVFHKEWLALHCISRFPQALAYYFHNPLANGKQGPIPEEMFQTPLTNKKQESLD
jgi:hypothetical protein